MVLSIKQYKEVSQFRDCEASWLKIFSFIAGSSDDSSRTIFLDAVSRW